MALARQMLAHIQDQEREIKLKDVKIEKITFELARLRAWKFGAMTEAMSAEQRRLFQETLAEDEASLQAQLQQAKGDPSAETNTKSTRTPRRQLLPAHLRRVEHHHEPEDTDCPTPGCGRAMVRVGENVSEKLDIVPAEFFVHRHIYGKRACRCCQRLVQEPVEPQIFDGGLPAAGLVAHTLLAALSTTCLTTGKRRSTPVRAYTHRAQHWPPGPGVPVRHWSHSMKRTSASYLQQGLLHADETPVAMLDPGAGKTKRAYVWAYARAHRSIPGRDLRLLYWSRLAVPDCLPGRYQRRRQRAMLASTLVRDEYAAYDSVLQANPGRIAAGCLAHARRRYDELLRNQGGSTVAPEALRRIAQIYRLERELATLSSEQRLARRHSDARPLWEQLHAWLQLERSRVPDGGITAKALDYSLKNWPALTHHLFDGEVSVDNNSLENLIRPWALGRKAWLFAGSELAGQRAAIVMSLVQSAKLHGHDPWSYRNDVLTRLPTHLNSRIGDAAPPQLAIRDLSEEVIRAA